MKWDKKYTRLAVTGGIVLLFVVLILAVTGKKKVSPNDDALPVVLVQKPEVKTLRESVSISGYVEAEAMIPVVPFVSGTIMEYPARAGDFVEKDQLLAKIDDEPFRQQMLQAQAAFFAAKSTYDRVATLFKSGATTQQNYDNARAQYDAAKAQYDLAMLQVGYTEVRAPVAGTILMADQAVGGIGNQSAPLAVLADLENQVVRLKVPEKYFDLFTLQKDSLLVTVTRPAEENLYEDAVTSATIENIAPYISPESKNFQVVCHLDNPGERFRPGMYVKVQVAYRVHENVPLLPIQTKKLDGSCYIYNPDEKTVTFIPPFDAPSDGEFFVVPPEYKDKLFVTDGQNFVFDGQKVRLYEEAVNEAL
ncbi:MAG: efflux RND transporter periplasmic adaptor subunit [Treponema sp.]|nr:efflux RND transporter periplasmic adaptor subunit [Treponema sp.]